MKKLTLVSGLLALALLASCGGGGSGGDQSSGVVAGDATRYAGTWVSCDATSGTTSDRDVVVITATGSNTFSFNESSAVYATANCTGPVTSTRSGTTGTVVFAGTKTVGTDTVDKGIVTDASGQRNQIFLVTATSLRSGRRAEDGGTLDAEGYPNTLDTAGLTAASASSSTPAPVAPVPAPLVCNGSYSVTVDLSSFACTNNWTFNGGFTVVGIDFEKTGSFTGDVTLGNMADEFQGAPGFCSPVNLRPAGGVFNGSMNLSRIGGGPFEVFKEPVSLQFSVGSLNTVLGTIAGNGITGKFSCQY